GARGEKWGKRGITDGFGAGPKEGKGLDITRSDAKAIDFPFPSRRQTQALRQTSPTSQCLLAVPPPLPPRLPPRLPPLIPGNPAPKMWRVILLFVGFFGASDGQGGGPGSPQTNHILSDLCIGCICEGSSNCNASVGCTWSDLCGPFYISRPYWIDARTPAVGDPNDPDAFRTCATDWQCAAATMRNYMQKHHKVS
ncbi:unnamed protein product, partial [Darwinula stevensoni]